ncbi:uncharacterized protein LOC118405855 [Branchiostoma floridae]|uniref:Uncharacterized protein LOC118405855 n=1 Tax=Branchiostoma floridae TaxID=7739 RepID=A0A9J7HL37_BRAFL|nr:uncharacterized protein LOC118405855 [Branchiostoma floridae]
MDISEGVMCSHCNTRVYRQLLVDHVQQELLSETTCRPCSDLVQTLTDLLCALHLYGHLKPPVINITCCRCSFQAGSVEKFVEHLQVSCEKVAPAQDTAVSDASAEQGSFKDSCQTYNAENEDEPVGTSSQGQDMGDWDGQQFQKMMSTLLTDMSGKGRQKTSSEHNTGGNCIATIDISSVFESQDDDTSIGLIMECERVKEPNPSQNVVEHDTENQENFFICPKSEMSEDRSKG